MLTISRRRTWLEALAFILVMPTLFFIIVSFLKYEMGVHEPFDSVAPTLENLGIRESLGWNINLLIIFGPVAAIIISVFLVTRMNWQNQRELLTIQFTLRKRWLPFFIIFLGGLTLSILMLYMVAENCNC